MNFRTVFAAAALTLSAYGASAASLDIEYDLFGDLQTVVGGSSGATVNFGGGGIPTENSLISFFGHTNTDGMGNVIDSNLLTLGLNITPRFQSPSVGFDGAGTYSAVTGPSTGGSAGTSAWNISFFAELFGGNDLIEDIGLELVFDFSPGVDTDESDLGILDLSLFANGSGLQTLQGSQNLAFSTFQSAGNPFVTQAAAGTFDPFASGEYTVGLRTTATNYADISVVGRVNVAPVPLPASGLILLAGIGAFGVLRRRQKRA